MSSSSQHQLFFVPETTYGTTPATPALTEYGITGTTLALTKNTVESERIKSDRQVVDVRDGNRKVGGNIDTEFAFGAFDVLLEALFCGSWTDDLLVPGQTRRSFTAVRHFADIASSAGKKPWHRFTGVEFNTMTLTLAPEAMVKATFGIIGQDWFLEDTVTTGATFPAMNTNRAFDSFVGEITIGGDPVAQVTGLNLTLENGLDPRFVLFKYTTNKPKIGKTRVKGQLSLYFEDSSLLAAFKAATLLNLEFSMQDPLGNTYGWSLPAIFPDSGQVDVSGENDITIPLAFTAIYDPVAELAISLQRTAVA